MSLATHILMIYITQYVQLIVIFGVTISLSALHEDSLQLEKTKKTSCRSRSTPFWTFFWVNTIVKKHPGKHTTSDYSPKIPPKDQRESERQQTSYKMESNIVPSLHLSSGTFGRFPQMGVPLLIIHFYPFFKIWYSFPINNPAILRYRHG